MILPLGKQVHRYNPKYSPQCPSCNADLEDNDHFWNSLAPTQIGWRRTFLENLKMKLIKLGTGPAIRNLLIFKLQVVLDCKNPNSVPEHPSVAEICANQKQIQWEQPMQGSFAIEWATHQQTQPGTARQPNRSCTWEVIDFIFAQWWHPWETRNQDRHGRDLATTQQARARQVDRELTMFYTEYKDQTPQHLRWLFDTPLEAR